MSIFQSDIWKIGVIDAPLSDILKEGSLSSFHVHWLPEAGSFRFLADPFGFWHEDILYCFAEYYDYRTRKGEIKAFSLDKNFRVLEQRTVLSEPWHLSYPYIIEDNGEIYMLPEGYKSGKLTLYRAKNFPWEWEKVPEFSFPCAAIDATPLYYDDRWWLFYAPPSPSFARTGELRIAYADHLLGQWQELAPYPFNKGKGNSRMGGTPLCLDGKVFLPTQNCLNTYGGNIQFISTSLPLTIHSKFENHTKITAPPHFKRFTNGIHTLSAAGNVTFLDAKYYAKNVLHRALIDLRYRYSK
ncbi:hypothetical protein GT348_08030 [Aristophania vespae]|uniref:Glucosamine inositolphosphorylceramide transferase 1 N-terminal domain-containing protein n=1 Tax=Aristophania vespae TaxID=2697033 RepID=A0A6P1NI20_9PROT|nr:hypothetical protein [Aristophania vespae]QHI96180.1 hypothetical protein GT348_08030 [Aristophania vespae]